MKKKLIIIVLFLSVSTIGFAQQVNDQGEYLRKTAITLVPQSFFASGLELALEQMIGSRFSLKAYGGYYTAEDPNLYSKAEIMNKYKLELQPRVYINAEDRGIEGFFFGGVINYRKTMLEDYKDNNVLEDITAEALGIGFNFGQQIIAGSGFSFDWFVGGMLVTPMNDFEAKKVNIAVINPYKRGIVPKVGVSLGYAF